MKCFDVTLEALDKALKFIDDNRLKKYNRSDYVNNLIGYFVFHREEITDKQQKNYLIPVIDQVVIDTDIQGRKLLIRPMKGIFEDED